MATLGETAPSLLVRIEQYTTAGLYGLLFGTILCLVSLRLSLQQPRIEHWPVTYTAGIWLWVFCFPPLFFAGYRRYGDSNRGPAVWLAGLPTIAMVAWTTYCRFFWPKLYPPTWNAPAYTSACWLYCSTYDPVWSNAAYGIALLGFGILALPLGLPALYEGYRRVRSNA